jgi:hypothetical protein
MGDFENWCTSYDKLVKWGIRIHVGINGGNHFVVWAHIATNKQKKTIFEVYFVAIAKYGHPLRIRSDFVCEHNLV